MVEARRLESVKDQIAQSALAGSSVCGGEEGAMNSRELQKELKLH
jgi:hypothetical protein